MAKLRIRGLAFSIGILLGQSPLWAGELKVDIQPVGLQEDQANVLTRLILERKEVRERLKGSRYRVIFSDFGGPEPLDKLSPEATSSYRVGIYDYTQDRYFAVDGNLDDLGSLRMEEDQAPPMPSQDEMEDAVLILQKELPGSWRPYQAMPGIVPGEKGRVVAVGLMPTGSDFHHEVVGVDLSRSRVIRYPEGAPPKAIARPMVCAPPSAWQGVTGRGTPGQSDITISRDGQTIWKFTAIRPSASSGTWGSGIELRHIQYRGKYMINRLHAPILNVHYFQDICGPYRDWQYSEDAFQAHGTLIAPGILRASSPPKTIYESGVDQGNFRGVAVYTDGTKTTLMSEVQAGWYRYATEYTFDEDGTIQPRWAFSAIQDSCTCFLHFHNAYWRMDFDIGSIGAPNSVEVSNGSSWAPIDTEASQDRDATHVKWRVLNRATGDGYEIIPGPDDGTADAFGRGDVWAVKYHRGQIEDANYYTGTSANIDAFLSGESISSADVVFWYGAHFRHESDGIASANRMVGPTLKLVR